MSKSEGLAEFKRRLSSGPRLDFDKLLRDGRKSFSDAMQRAHDTAIEPFVDAIELAKENGLFDCNCGTCPACDLYQLAFPPTEPQHDLGER